MALGWPDRSASRSIAGSATAIRSPEIEIAALEAAGIPLERTRRDKDESDTELAVAAALRLGADGVVVVGALGGPRIDHALANLGLLAMPGPRPAGARSCSTGGRGSRSSAPRTSMARRSRAARGSHRRPRLAAAHRAPASIGVTTHGLRYPLADEPLPPGAARGLSNVRTSPEPAEVVLRRGLLLVMEIPCYALTMDMPAVGDAAPEVALPDETGAIHDLSAQRGRWTILYFYPADDTPGCTVEACEFRDANDDHPRARGRRVGHQPAGRQVQAPFPREVRPAVHAPGR